MGNQLQACCGDGSSHSIDKQNEISSKVSHGGAGFTGNGNDQGWAADADVDPYAESQIVELEFSVTLQKGPKDKIGIDVDHKDATRLLVERVQSAGLVRAYNDSVKKAGKKTKFASVDEQRRNQMFKDGQYIKNGDYIVAINGQRSSVAMIQECKSKSTLVMDICRFR